LNSVSAHSLALPQAKSLFLLTGVSSIYIGLRGSQLVQQATADVASCYQNKNRGNQDCAV